MTRRTKISLAVTLLAMTSLAFTVALVPKLSASEGEAVPKRGDAWLGVYMQDINSDINEAFDLTTDRGVFVDDVVDDSPADLAGVKAKDVIIRLDSEPISDSKDLVSAVGKKDPGDSVQVVVLRNGKEIALSAELGRERSSNKIMQWYDGQSGSLHNIPGVQPFGLMLDSDGGYLGVSTIELSDQLAEYFGVEKGVLVSQVEEDTPAEQAGLKAGDIITKVDDEVVESPSDLRDIIRDHEKGDKVAVEVIRKGQPMTITAELDETSGSSTYGNVLRQYFDQSGKIPNVDKFRMYYSDEDQKKLQEEMEQLKEELKSLKDQLGDIRQKMK